MKKYESFNTWIYTEPYYLLLQGKNLSIDVLHDMLIEMIVYGNMRGVRYLIEKGADIHFLDDNALIVASEEGQFDIVKYLVEQGANIHADDDDALMSASIKGHLNIVKYLVEHGANIHTNNGDAIRLAKKRGHMDVFRYLTDKSRV